MRSINTKRISRRRKVKGSGLIGDVVGTVLNPTKAVVSTVGKVAGTVLNKAIDLLPVELHVPGYNYCGPGTNLKKRLARGDRGINKLDEACKEHDIAYSQYSDNENRRKADQLLADRAWERVKSSDASLGERATAWTVTTAMNAKKKMGGGIKMKKKKNKCSCGRVSKRKNVGGRGLRLGPYKGHGLRMKPYKGSGVSCKKQKKKTRVGKKKLHAR